MTGHKSHTDRAFRIGGPTLSYVGLAVDRLGTAVGRPGSTKLRSRPFRSGLPGTDIPPVVRIAGLLAPITLRRPAIGLP